MKKLLGGSAELVTIRKYMNIMLCILVGTLVYIGPVYMYTKLVHSGNTLKVTAKNLLKQFGSTKRICRRPDGSMFTHDHLRKLDIANINNKSAYEDQDAANKPTYISQNYSNLTEFIEKTRLAFMSRRFIRGSHSLHTIFRHPPYKDMVKPSCDGLWMEFGVFRGSTLSLMAQWKTTYCGKDSEPVYGFDTFSGLPTDWRPGFGRGAFNIGNQTKISVPSNVVLVKGLFIDTLPIHLRSMDLQHQCKMPVSFVHIDCDIYDGARDVLFLLGSRFLSGTIIVFDELFNYPGYEKHEIKALFEFLSGSNLRLLPLGTPGDIELKPTYDLGIHSFAFVTDLEEV